MREIVHFESTKERLKYLKGGFEEIIPQEAQAIVPQEERPKKRIYKRKKKEESDEVQAE